MELTTLLLSASTGVLLMVVTAVGLELYLARRDMKAMSEERRALEYQVMHLAVKLEDERERAARRRERLVDAARQVEEMKRAVEDALELIAAYKLVGAAPSALGLHELRDGLSDFGKLMAADPPAPKDLASQSEWGSFK